ncbi:MAG: glycosyltransferase family 4 protein [bacterium]|nr:glycosyltransferase family 4 protein [bacterium]
MNNKTLGLFFSYGVGIGTWEKQGYLNRELKYYQALANQLGKVSFFTYQRPGLKGLRDRVSLTLISVFPKKQRIPNWLYVLLMPFLLKKEIKECDILKTNQMSGALPAVLAKLIYRKKLVVRCGYEWLYTLQKANKPLWKKAVVYTLEYLAYKTANKIIFTSKADKGFAQKTFKIKESKIALIPNYIDTDLFKPLSNITKEPNFVCYVGRLSKEKNVSALIEAISGLPQAKLYIAGGGPLKGELQKQVIDLGVKERVVFLGKVPNEHLPQLLNKCEVFALPSLYEGNPKALLEAMACGLPCLASDIEGINEIIKHNQNGLLVAASKDEIRQALSLLFKDKALSERLAKQARATLEESFSLKQIISKELNLFKAIYESAK